MAVGIDLFDLENNTHKSIFTGPAYTAIADAVRLNADEAVFSLYEQMSPQTDTNAAQIRQIILKYNIPKDKISIIYPRGHDRPHMTGNGANTPTRRSPAIGHLSKNGGGL